MPTIVPFFKGLGRSASSVLVRPQSREPRYSVRERNATHADIACRSESSATSSRV